MGECLRCGRKLKDPDALYGWRCAQKVGFGNEEQLTDDEMDRIVEQYLEDIRNGKGYLWQGNPLLIAKYRTLAGDVFSSSSESQKILPSLGIFKHIQKHNMKYIGSEPVNEYISPEFRGFQVLKYRSDSNSSTQYTAEIVVAEKTAKEWRNWISENFKISMKLREFLQLGGDSLAFDGLSSYISEKSSRPDIASNILSLGLSVLPSLLGDAPPQMKYILKQLEGHSDNEKVIIVFEEKAWKQETGFWATILGLDERFNFYSKKHY